MQTHSKDDVTRKDCPEKPPGPGVCAETIAARTAAASLQRAAPQIRQRGMADCLRGLEHLLLIQKDQQGSDHPAWVLMGLFDVFRRKQRWIWRVGAGAPPPDVADAMVRSIHNKNTRLKVLEHAVELTAGCQEGGSHAEAAAVVLCEAGILEAAAEVLQHADPLTQDELEAILQLARSLSQLPDRAFRPALEGSGLVAALVGLLTGDKHSGAAPAPAGTSAAAGSRRGAYANGMGLELPAATKVEVLRGLRGLARRGAVRDELKQGDGIPTLVAAVCWAVQEGDFTLGGEAAWTLELLAVSRRLCNRIGEMGGVAAAVSLLRTALSSRPTIRELPRGEEASAAASSAVHALSVLLTDSRANRGRLRGVAGGVPALADVLGDAQLDWETKEQAGGLLEDLAATLQLDEGPLGDSPHFEEWRTATVPRLVAVLQQYRGLPYMQQTKQVVAGVLEKLAGNGVECSVLVRDAGALPPLVQLLSIGTQMAGGERRLCCVVLGALRELALANKDAMAQASAPSGGRQVQLLDLLSQLVDEGAEGDPQALARGWEEESSVEAGWLAAEVAARLCCGHQPNQDGVVSRGMLRPLCTYLQAPLGLPRAPGAVADPTREALLRIKCGVAEALRSLSLRAAHHPALRAAGVARHAQRVLASTAPTWTELRAAAKKILQNLGEILDLDRPLLTYSPDHLAHLLQAQGIEAQRFREHGIGGAEFVRLSDADMRDMVLAAQHPRVLCVLRAYEAFDEVDSAGMRDGCITFGKLVAYLGARGLRQDEIVPLAESLMQLMDGDRDDLVAFPDFLQCYEEFRARAMLDVQPPSKRRRTSMAP